MAIYSRWGLAKWGSFQYGQGETSSPTVKTTVQIVDNNHITNIIIEGKITSIIHEDKITNRG